MADDVYALRGQFVVEFGVRQAWPFLTFCDNAKTPPDETRLYIDTIFRVGSGPTLFTAGDPDPAVEVLADLNSRTVTNVALGEGNELTITFDDGQQVLRVSSEASAFTTGEIWWLGHLQ